MELQSGNTHFWSKLANFVSCHLEIWNWYWILSLEMLNSGQKCWFLGPCDLEIWWLILKINRAPLLCPSRLCALFHNQWIQTEVTTRKCPIWVKIVNFVSSVTLKFDDDLEKQKDILTMLLQTQCIISQPSVNSNWSYSLETPNSGQNWQVFVPCDLEIWQMTLKNNRAPLLCYFKLSASLHSHWPIRAEVTVWKRPIWIKFDDFFASCDLEILQMYLKNTHSSFMHHFKAIGEFRFEWQSENAQIGSNLTTFRHLWPWHFTYDLQK